jgi:hypothetical protein
MSPEIFQRKLSKQQANTLNEYLLRHYLSHQKDIKTCPKSQCDYAGISGHLPKFCYTYTCAKCGTSWKDKPQVDMGSYAKKYTDGLATAKNELLSNIYKRFTGNLCPNCTVYITKEGGCSHMVCNKCKHQFCWMCLNSYFNYRHSGIRPCGLRWLYLTFLMGLMCMLVFLKLSLRFNSSNSVLDGITWSGIGFGLGLLELLSTLGLATFSWALTWEKFKGTLKGRMSDFTFTMILLFVFSLSAGYNYTLYVCSMFLYVWWFIFYAAAGIGTSTGTIVLFRCGMDEIFTRNNKLCGLNYIGGSSVMVMSGITLFTSLNMLHMAMRFTGFVFVLAVFVQLIKEVHYKYQIKARNKGALILTGITLAYLFILIFFNFTSVWHHIVYFAFFVTGCYLANRCLSPFKRPRVVRYPNVHRNRLLI